MLFCCEMILNTTEDVSFFRARNVICIFCNHCTSEGHNSVKCHALGCSLNMPKPCLVKQLSSFCRFSLRMKNNYSFWSKDGYKILSYISFCFNRAFTKQLQQLFAFHCEWKITVVSAREEADQYGVLFCISYKTDLDETTFAAATLACNLPRSSLQHDTTVVDI